MELYAFPKGEGVGFAVFAHHIVTGHGGAHASVGAGLHQALEDIEQHLFGTGIHRPVRIKAVQIL